MNVCQGLEVEGLQSSKAHLVQHMLHQRSSFACAQESTASSHSVLNRCRGEWNRCRGEWGPNLFCVCRHRFFLVLLDLVKHFSRVFWTSHPHYAQRRKVEGEERELGLDAALRNFRADARDGLKRKRPRLVKLDQEDSRAVEPNHGLNLVEKSLVSFADPTYSIRMTAAGRGIESWPQASGNSKPD